MVAGYSMGAQQAFQWAVSYPETVQRIAPWCGHARTTPHTYVFLAGLAAALGSDPAFNGCNYTTQPEQGLRTAARVAAGWPLSQAWYRQELYKRLGSPRVEDFLVRFWEGFLLRHDANNLLGQIRTWQIHNVGWSQGFGGDYRRGLASVGARAVIMPSQTDLYFPAEDSEVEASCIPKAELRVIPSIWGHFAGIGMNAVDSDFIDGHITECLAAD
jgi:homoserine O-acetyltransferase/O-succinyltransferase